MQDAQVPFLPAGMTEEARRDILGWPCVAGRKPAAAQVFQPVEARSRQQERDDRKP